MTSRMLEYSWKMIGDDLIIIEGEWWACEGFIILLNF